MAMITHFGIFDSGCLALDIRGNGEVLDEVLDDNCLRGSLLNHQNTPVCKDLDNFRVHPIRRGFAVPLKEETKVRNLKPWETSRSTMWSAPPGVLLAQSLGDGLFVVKCANRVVRGGAVEGCKGREPGRAELGSPMEEAVRGAL
ncbi:hypothetical protein HPP92_021522 [Vanilla planifolia]|uniref:Uncharacterized protein n=1 Tax=Vanilla planifolia TaxID=51239 RepID=A0A835PVQ8_VANPL|nr:hypothetical protein HPP92_021522 [Vanilla planifolia]